MATVNELVSQALQEYLKQVKESGYYERDLESFGYFLKDYIIKGGEITVADKQVSLTEMIACLDQTLYRVHPKSFTATESNKTYYIDFTKTNGFLIGETHPIEPYLPVWTLTTDATGVISAEDQRGITGGVRFKEDIAGIIIDSIAVAESNIVDDSVSHRKIKGTIQESKLALDHPTKDLNSRITNIVSNAGSSNSEIVDARLNGPNTIAYSTLKERLDDEHDSIDTRIEKNARELKPQYNNNDTPIVTFVDDDGYSAFMTAWKPVADAKGIKISLGVVSSWVGQPGRLTLAQLKQLQDEGYDILSHSNTHASPITATDDQWLEELRLSSEFMKANGFNSDTIVLPVGYRDVATTQRVIELKALTRRYYQYAIDATETVNPLPVDSMQIQRVGFDNADFANMKSVVDKAVSRKQWLVVMTHTSLYPDANYSEIIDYIQSKNVPILTVTEALKRVGNTVSLGDTKSANYCFIGKDAKVNISNTLQISTQTANMTKVITDYAFKKITVEQVSDTLDTLTGRGGILHTYNGDVNFSYQIYYVAKSSEVYKRYWDYTNSLWSPFVLISASAPTTTYTPTLYGSTIAGTPTYTTQKANYSKIGNRVFFDIDLVLSAKADIDGGLRITLPTTSKVGLANINCTIGWVGRLTYGTAKEITAQIASGLNYITLYKTVDAISPTNLLATDISDLFRISVSGNYETA